MNLKSFNNSSQEHPKVLETLKIIEELETVIGFYIFLIAKLEKIEIVAGV